MTFLYVIYFQNCIFSQLWHFFSSRLFFLAIVKKIFFPNWLLAIDFFHKYDLYSINWLFSQIWLIFYQLTFFTNMTYILSIDFFHKYDLYSINWLFSQIWLIFYINLFSCNPDIISHNSAFSPHNSFPFSACFRALCFPRVGVRFSSI